MFNSISKPGYQAGINLEDLEIFLKQERKIKIIGLGGINAENLEKVNNINLDGYAVLGSIWTNNPSNKVDYAANMEKIISCLN